MLKKILVGACDDVVKVQIGPIIRVHAKRFRDSMQAFVRAIHKEFGVPKSIEGSTMEGAKDCILIWVEESAQNEVVKKLDREKLDKKQKSNPWLTILESNHDVRRGCGSPFFPTTGLMSC